MTLTATRTKIKRKRNISFAADTFIRRLSQSLKDVASVHLHKYGIEFAVFAVDYVPPIFTGGTFKMAVVFKIKHISDNSYKTSYIIQRANIDTKDILLVGDPLLLYTFTLASQVISNIKEYIEKLANVRVEPITVNDFPIERTMGAGGKRFYVR